MGIRIVLVAVALGCWLPRSWAGPQIPAYYVHEEQALASIAPASSELMAGDFFGRCVSISGNRVVVGAENEGAGNAGSVYVFTRSGTDWSFEANLIGANEGFGQCVAISGNTIVVGAPSNTIASLDTGAIHVFFFDGTNWGAQASPLLVSGVAAGDHFGSSVAIDGDLIVVGARFADVNVSLPDAGRVHAFERLPMATTWTEQTGSPIVAMNGASADAGAFDEFGHSVALHGTTLVVGAPREDEAFGNDAGSAYVYERVGTDWVAGPKIVPSSRFPFSQFGDCVTVYGDTIAVGAPLGMRGADVSGSVSIFDRTGTTWVEDATFSASDSADNDRFGDCLALGDQRLVVGAWNDLHQHQVLGAPFLAIGSAYLFEFDTQTMSWVEAIRFCPAAELDHGRFGAAVALDMDRTAVGAWQANDLEGAAQVFRLIDPAPVDHCSGDGGDQMGCTNCPCGNNAPLGTIGGCLNSLSLSPRLSASGDTSVSLMAGDTEDLRFGLSGAAPNSLCVLTSGSNVASVNMSSSCFGLLSGVQSIEHNGLRCAVMNIRRHGARSADSNGNVGSMMMTPPWGGEGGPNAGIALAGAGFVAGQTRFFQCTMRDTPSATCTKDLSTSQAVEISFVP